LSIPAIAEQLGGVELPDPIALAPALGVVLGKVTDPRKAGGIRHRLVVLLTVTVCAVAAGARSFVAVAEWVADLPMALADTLGTGDRCPSESTIRRAVRDIDAVIGGFVQQLSAAMALVGRRRVLAVDGKNPARVPTHRPRRERGGGPVHATLTTNDAKPSAHGHHERRPTIRPRWTASGCGVPTRSDPRGGTSR
jgi:hypothetical protein